MVAAVQQWVYLLDTGDTTQTAAGAAGSALAAVTNYQDTGLRLYKEFAAARDRWHGECD